MLAHAAAPCLERRVIAPRMLCVIEPPANPAVDNASVRALIDQLAGLIVTTKERRCYGVWRVLPRPVIHMPMAYRDAVGQSRNPGTYLADVPEAWLRPISDGRRHNEAAVSGKVFARRCRTKLTKFSS